MTRSELKKKSRSGSGFFYRALSDSQKRVYEEEVARTAGLDEEISQLKRLIAGLRANNPENHKSITKAQQILVRLSEANRYLKENGDERLRRGIISIIDDIPIPVGLASLSDP
jgi:hypothetical protein